MSAESSRFERFLDLPHELVEKEVDSHLDLPALVSLSLVSKSRSREKAFIRLKPIPKLLEHQGTLLVLRTIELRYWTLFRFFVEHFELKKVFNSKDFHDICGTILGNNNWDEFEWFKRHVNRTLSSQPTDIEDFLTKASSSTLQKYLEHLSRTSLGWETTKLDFEYPAFFNNNIPLLEWIFTKDGSPAADGSGVWGALQNGSTEAVRWIWKAMPEEVKPLVSEFLDVNTGFSSERITVRMNSAMGECLLEILGEEEFQELAPDLIRLSAKGQHDFLRWLIPRVPKSLFDMDFLGRVLLSGDLETIKVAGDFRFLEYHDRLEYLFNEAALGSIDGLKYLAALFPNFEFSESVFHSACKKPDCFKILEWLLEKQCPYDPQIAFSTYLKNTTTFPVTFSILDARVLELLTKDFTPEDFTFHYTHCIDFEALQWIVSHSKQLDWQPSKTCWEELSCKAFRLLHSSFSYRPDILHLFVHYASLGNLQVLHLIYFELGYGDEIKLRVSEIPLIFARKCSYSSQNPGMPDGIEWLLDQGLVTLGTLLGALEPQPLRDENGLEFDNLGDRCRAIRALVDLSIKIFGMPSKELLVEWKAVSMDDERTEDLAAWLRKRLESTPL